MDLIRLQKEYGIGLTGGIACGKSLVAKFLNDQGYTVIDADRLSRISVEPGGTGYNQVIAAFGREILSTDGTIDRSLLRNVVFNSPSKRKLLESIIHPRIYELLHQELEKQNFYTSPRIWFFEASLLVESGSYQNFKSLWIVTCDAEIQLERLMYRDKISATLAQSIISSQMDLKSKALFADVLITNNGTSNHLEEQILTAIKNLSSSKTP